MPQMIARAQASADALLATLQGLVDEIHKGRTSPSAALDSDLEADLGIDSLARVELMLRLDRDLELSLPEEQVFEARTARDLLNLAPRIETTTQAGCATTPPVPAPATRPAAPEGAATLAEALLAHADRTPDWTYLSFHREETQAETLTCGELADQAGRVARGLREAGVESGQCVAIMLPSGCDFFRAYFGVLLAGAVPVPIYPPTSRSQLQDHLTRQAGILDNAQAVVLIAGDETRAFTVLLRRRLPGLHDIATVEQLLRAGPPVQLRGAPEDLALIQYTSGSTGHPKGVMLSHANLLANVRSMGRALAVNGDDVFVSWLPLYHDMGLIGACLGTLYHGIPLHLMSPLSFVSRPRRWLRAISAHQGTLSAGPNFAYQVCATRLRDAELEGLDLSSWRLALNGAEPVHPATLERFCERFAPYGFRREALLPVYGLAENAVGLAFPPLGRGPRIDRVQRDVFLDQGVARPAAWDSGEVLEFVCCGIPIPDHEIRIVDDTGLEAPERRQGRIQFRGPSATRGYFRNPGATAALFDGDWLNTGDYGYLADGELHVTGREKDLIVRAGRNLYPYELEQAIGDLPGIRRDAVAVFGSPDPDSGVERLVVLAETRERDPARRAQLLKDIERLTLERLDSPPDEVLLVRPRTVLKTSSGKIRRLACRYLYERGRLASGPGTPSWRERLALLHDTGLPLLRRGLRRTGQYLYAGYAWTLFGLVGGALALLLTFVGRPARAQWLAHRAARLLGLLAAIPFRVEGTGHLPREGGFVIAANHASYLDAIVLFAALDTPLHFVAKQELRAHAPVRRVLERLGTVFVQRGNVKQGVQETEQLARAVRDGRHVVFFPEGTFTRASGLRPFRLGAFATAAAAAAPLVPVAIRGTRQALRGDTWFPRRGRIEVRVLEPIRPRANDWAAILELRDKTRAAILAHCDEPDLAEQVSIALPDTEA